MADDTSQRAAHKFLLQYLQTQEPFTLEEFSRATGWIKPGTINAYRSKQYKGLIEKIAGKQYRVTDAFRKFASWRRFKAHVTQVRPVVTNYDPVISNVLIYDFLMPLTNEEHLRMTLDSLFYKDRIEARLRAMKISSLEQHIKREQLIDDDEYYATILEFIKDRFVGYSISHVDGRFRSDNLLSGDEAAELEKRGQRYLIDETTAVTRFMFPYQDQQELEWIQFLFNILFIRSIIQLVNGEEQIWMLQSGSAGSQVHIWHALTEEDG